MNKLLWSSVVALAIAVLCVNIPGSEPARSGRWDSVRHEHLDTQFYCALCGVSKDLEVHPLRPFHLDPSLELVATNLITLCRYCHLQAGHLGNWTNAVPDLKAIIGDVGQKLHLLRLNRESAAPVATTTNPPAPARASARTSRREPLEESRTWNRNPTTKIFAPRARHTAAMAATARSR